MKWISVTERLPKKIDFALDGLEITILDEVGHRHVYRAWYFESDAHIMKSHWEISDDRGHTIPFEVIAWRKAPKPWKGKNEHTADRCKKEYEPRKTGGNTGLDSFYQK